MTTSLGQPSYFIYEERKAPEVSNLLQVPVIISAKSRPKIRFWIFNSDYFLINV